jgi:hypothetical protein
VSEGLVAIADGVWVERAPLRFLGVLELGTRMTILRAGDGLVVHSPIPIDAERKKAIDALGTVRSIVAPNLFHHLYAGPAAELWPEATLVAPRALRKKSPKLAIRADLEDGPLPAWADEIETYVVKGSLVRETLLWHRPSKTLITSDLFENFQAVDHFATRAYLKLGGVYGKPGWHWMLRPVYRDKPAARASLAPVFDLPIERIVIGHGEIVTERAVDTARGALAFLG